MVAEQSMRGGVGGCPAATEGAGEKSHPSRQLYRQLRKWPAGFIGATRSSSLTCDAVRGRAKWTTFVLILVAVALSATAFAAEKAPKAVAQELLEVYGQKLDDVQYIPALAVLCRARFGELSGEAKYRQQAEEIVAKYVRESPEAKSDTQLAGHLVFAELARKEGPHRAEYQALVQRASSSRKSFLPGDTAMSDAVFMCGPILCEGERYEEAIAFLQAMRKLRVREDGLYRHGHLCDVAWGRGNGFPAVGVAWCLSALPEEQAGRAELLEAFGQHMAALLKHQDRDGMWHQVVDGPESYAEFSCTCMIGFAMQRGIERGWLEEAKYRSAVEKAWSAIGDRIEPGGKLRGVCEGTGTQPSLEAYLKRKAIHGVDQRGGAMALLFATERMAAGK